jgi:predicted glycoside hydrolase/deacetylase ChbG (UPF0249 family)
MISLVQTPWKGTFMIGIRTGRWIFAAALVAVGATNALAQETWAEKLGFPAGKKVLLIHADDIGMCYEANEAAKQALEGGWYQSAAAMVPCPWFNEFANWYKEHPQYDVGLHLALTSEWKWYRWGPVAPKNEVPGLLDKDGYLHRDVVSVALNAKPAEVEKEIRAQLARAVSRGVKPSHIDTHMGTLYARPDFTEVYLRVAMEHRIPAMAIEMSPHLIDKFRKQGYPITDKGRQVLAAYTLPKLDDFEPVPEGKTYDQKRTNFFNMVKSLRPGLTESIFHPSVMTEGLRHITGSAQQRAWEYQLFNDPEVKEFFQKEGIILTNWKEIMKRWDAKNPPKNP